MIRRYTVIFAATAPLLLSACQQKPNEELLSVCWSPSAKETVKSLAKQMVSRHIVKAIEEDDGGKHKHGDIDAYVQRNLNVEISNIYVTAADTTSGSVSCGADAAMVFKRADGKTLTADSSSFSFAVYRSENQSSMYSIPTGLQLTQMIDSATVSEDSSQPKTPPIASAPTSPKSAPPASDSANGATDAASAAASATEAASQ
jgi:hypothetical protein